VGPLCRIFWLWMLFCNWAHSIRRTEKNRKACSALPAGARREGSPPYFKRRANPAPPAGMARHDSQMAQGESEPAKTLVAIEPRRESWGSSEARIPPRLPIRFPERHSRPRKALFAGIQSRYQQYERSRWVDQTIVEAGWNRRGWAPARSHRMRQAGPFGTRSCGRQDPLEPVLPAQPATTAAPQQATAASFTV
jgi:hypothetical protein